MTNKERVAAIMKEAVGADMSSWERYTFLPSVVGWRGTLSIRQEKTLRGIERRVLGLPEEED